MLLSFLKQQQTRNCYIQLLVASKYIVPSKPINKKKEAEIRYSSFVLHLLEMPSKKNDEFHPTTEKGKRALTEYEASIKIVQELFIISQCNFEPYYSFFVLPI